MEVLLGRSHAEKQVLFTWAFGVVPSGLSLSWPDMSQYMRLLSVSDESADSEGSASMAVGLSAYLAEGGDGLGQDSRVRLPSVGGHEVPAARCSVFARDFR